MASSNMNMRDPVLYRIMFAEHHNTGSSWCIYPMYDFAHPLEDAYEHITHSLCTLEFENHRPLYDWVIENCPVPARPRQTEFARLNLTYTVMSKRKLLQLVQEGHVSGWDDPRMPTVSGMRRRGYTPAAIRNFCHTIGITKFNGFTDVALLEYSVREDLNANAPRRMAVLNPLKVTITTLPENAEEMAEVLNNPEKPEEGVRRLPITREVWIERDDFMLDPPKNTSVWPPAAPYASGGLLHHLHGLQAGCGGNYHGNLLRTHSRHHRLQPSGRNPVPRRHSLGKRQIRGGRRNPHL